MAPVSHGPLESAIGVAGYAFLRAGEMRQFLTSVGPLSDWAAYAASWNDLALDTYMADGGRYRRRRHAVYAVSASGAIARQPHQPHFQSRDYNTLNGGIARWFEPIAEPVGAGDSLHTILRFGGRLFGQVASNPVDWRVEVHQFRIEGRLDTPGQPTPEGAHRDGVDYVLVLLIARSNIRHGTTTITGLDGQPLGAFTLADPFDAALVDDARVYHGVTPVEPIDPAQPAYRDVLVVTYARSNADR